MVTHEVNHEIMDRVESSRIKVEENIGLVHLCAKRFVGRGMDYDDIFQAGCLGLVKAAENFDETLGNKFSTYAVPVILGEMKSIFRTGTALKISRGVRELANRAQSEAEQIREERGESPNVSEIADRLGISIAKAAMALGANKAPISLTADEQNSEIQIPVDAPEEQMINRLTLKQLLDMMEEKDRTLILLRYFKGKTQQETAEILGMTQVQVSRREKKLLLQMREQM